MVKPFEYKIKVRFSDTDLYGIAHHSNYFKWLEESRFALLEKILELSINSLEDENLRFPVIQVEGNYKNPVLAGEEITVQVILYYKYTSKLQFEYLILNSNHKVVFKGVTVHVATTNNKMLLKMPSEFEKIILEKFRKYDERFIVVC